MLVKDLIAVPKLFLPFYRIRAFRLSLAICFCIWLGARMNLSDENALALFITPLLMAISDRTTSILLRLKMLSVVWSGLFIMTLGVAFFCHTILGIILFMFVLVRAAYYFSFRFPPKNLFFTIVLLGFSFFLPLNLNLDTVPYFLFWMFIGGLVYVSSLLLGYLIYLYFSGNRALNWANFFYLDPEHGTFYPSYFLASREEARMRRQDEGRDERKYILSHPYRLALSMLMAFLSSLYLDAQNEYWIMMTVILIHNPSSRITAGLPRIMKRFFGTILGLGVMYVLGIYTWDISLVLALIFLCVFFIFLSIQDNYFFAVIFITMMVLSVMKIRGNLFQEVLFERLLDTVLAIVLVLLCHFIVLLFARVLERFKPVS